ncbi:MAG: hypothetical protein HYZ16_12025 [Bacteroidetes bacterium]|jgi:predicted thioesterase|nr:hypothetical protein [Bacteroidota bacterium]
MRNLFQAGDTKEYAHVVQEADLAAFPSGAVHPVYATFALGRDAEWCCRLFVLDMKEDGEEGIGTSLTIQHVSPALVGQQVCFTASLVSINGNDIQCKYEARVGNRLVAQGMQGQKILLVSKLKQIFSNL